MALRTYEEGRAVRQRRIGRLWRRFSVRIAVSLFVIWHVYALAIYNLPNDNALINNVVMGPVMKYLTGIQAEQAWNLFAPTPYGANGYIARAEAHITYADGTTRVWHFPQPSTQNLVLFGHPVMNGDGTPVHDYWRGYNTERWRKYIEVIDNNSDVSYLWPDMAIYAARVNNIYPNNPPTTVKLVKYWAYVRCTPAQDSPAQTWFHTEPITTEELQ